MSRFAVRRLDQTGVSPLGNVIKAGECQVVAEADRLLAALTRNGRQAHDAARAAGREAGEAEGREAAAQLLADARTATRSHLRKSEQRLVDIVVDAVSRILGEFDDVELAARMVRQLIDEVEGEGKIRLHVSPAQFRAIADAAGSPGVEVVADSEVPDGACRMETELGFVDTSVEAQLQALRRALERYGEESSA